MTHSEAVEVTQEQLRKALVMLLGSSAEVTARDFRTVLPRCHKSITREAWKAAAEAEGLEIEGEKPWGITIWRKGATKQAIKHARRREGVQGATNATMRKDSEGNNAQPGGVLQGLRGKSSVPIAANSKGNQAPVTAKSGAMRTEAVSLPDVQGLAPGAPQAPKVADAQSVRELAEYERHHGRELSYAQASELLAISSDDPKQIALRAQQHIDAEAKQGRTCSYSQAVKAVTNQQS